MFFFFSEQQPMKASLFTIMLWNCDDFSCKGGFWGFLEKQSSKGSSVTSHKLALDVCPPL